MLLGSVMIYSSFLVCKILSPQEFVIDASMLHFFLLASSEYSMKCFGCSTTSRRRGGIGTIITLGEGRGFKFSKQFENKNAYA